MASALISHVSSAMNKNFYFCSFCTGHSKIVLLNGHQCGCGEIGRRTRFRFWRLWRGGSSPSTRTTLQIAIYINGLSDFVMQTLYALIRIVFNFSNFLSKFCLHFVLKKHLFTCHDCAFGICKLSHTLSIVMYCRQTLTCNGANSFIV